MTKKIWIIAIVVFFCLTGILIWHFVRKDKRKFTESSGTASTENEAIFPLKIGSKGENVKRLQAHLNGRIESSNKLGEGVPTWTMLPLLTVDGVFGEKTELEVLRYYSVKEVSQELFNLKNM